MALATLDEVASLEGLAMTQIASEPFKAGQPAYVAPDGTLYLASAASGAGRAFVDGFARADTLIGTPCSLDDRLLTLSDWTAVIGSASLMPGTRYFLAPQNGKLIASAPNGTGQAIIRVGVALNAQTLKIQITDLTGSLASSGTPAPILQALGLSTLAGTAGQAFSATISGTTAGSTLAATAADGTVLTIANGALSGTFASAGQKQISIVETLAGATGSPKTTTLTLTIAAAVPVLQALGLASLNAVAGQPFSAAISSQTAGSTIAATSSDGTALTVANGQVSGTFAAVGSPTITLTETLAGATGSPKSTQLAVTVSATAPAQPAGLAADFSDAMNTTVL